MNPSRTLALSDSTFAVAMTLLIFDVRFSPNAVHSVGADLWSREWPHYVGYAVSFVVVAMIWMNHHAVFRLVHQVSHTTMLLNLALLGFVVFIPFPTQVMAAYLEARSGSAHWVGVFYGLTLALTTLMLAVLWHHLSRRGDLTHRLDPEGVRRLTLRLYATPVLYLVATGIAAVWLPAGLAAFLAVACGYLLHTGTRATPDVLGDDSPDQTTGD